MNKGTSSRAFPIERQWVPTMREMRIDYVSLTLFHIINHVQCFPR